MKKKFAFLLMGPHYTPEKHNAVFETEKQFTYIVSVKNIEEAFEKVVSLVNDGVGAIELCGAFKAENARKIAELTDNKAAIGYVTHEKDQDPLFAKFFG